MGVRKDLFSRDPYKVPITDFFGSVRPIELIYAHNNNNINDNDEDFEVFELNNGTKRSNSGGILPKESVSNIKNDGVDDVTYKYLAPLLYA